MLLFFYIDAFNLVGSLKKSLIMLNNYKLFGNNDVISHLMVSILNV